VIEKKYTIFQTEVKEVKANAGSSPVSSLADAAGAAAAAFFALAIALSTTDFPAAKCELQ